MGEFLKKKIGQHRYDQIVEYLQKTEHPQQMLRQPLPLQFKDMLVGEICDSVEEAKQLKDRIRLLEVICKGGLSAASPTKLFSVSQA